MAFGPLLTTTNPNITDWLPASDNNQNLISSASEIDADLLVQGIAFGALADFTYGSQSILAGHVYYWDATNSVFVDVVQINAAPETTVLHGLISASNTTGGLEAISTIIVGANNTLTGSAASALTLTTVSAATPADIAITGALATGTNMEGSDITFTAGASNGSASGGDIFHIAGAGGATGAGGDLSYTAGAGGATSGNGGNLLFTGGAATAGNGNGGGITLTAGAKNGSGTPGAITLSGRLAMPAATNTTSAAALSAGTVTLIAGSAIVNTSAITANSIVMLTRQSIGSTGAAALGMLSVGVVTPGTSFVINALTTANATAPLAADVSVIGWHIIN